MCSRSCGCGRGSSPTTRSSPLPRPSPAVRCSARAATPASSSPGCSRDRRGRGGRRGSLRGGGAADCAGSRRRLAEKAVTVPGGTIADRARRGGERTAAARWTRWTRSRGRGRRRAHRAARHPGPAAGAGTRRVVDAAGSDRRRPGRARRALRAGLRVDAPNAVADTALVGAVSGSHARVAPHAHARAGSSSSSGHPTAGPVTRSCSCWTARTTGGPPPSAPHSTGSATRWPSSATVPRTAAGPGTCTCTARTSEPRSRPGSTAGRPHGVGSCAWSTAARCVPASGPCSRSCAPGDGEAGPRRPARRPGALRRGRRRDRRRRGAARRAVGTAAARRPRRPATPRSPAWPSAVADIARRAGHEVVVVPSRIVVAGWPPWRARPVATRRRRRRHDRGGRRTRRARCRSPTRGPDLAGLPRGDVLGLIDGEVVLIARTFLSVPCGWLRAC